MHFSTLPNNPTHIEMFIFQYLNAYILSGHFSTNYLVQTCSAIKFNDVSKVLNFKISSSVEGFLVYGDCNAPWGKFVICDFRLYK